MPCEVMKSQLCLCGSLKGILFFGWFHLLSDVTLLSPFNLCLSIRPHLYLSFFSSSLSSQHLLHSRYHLLSQKNCLKRLWDNIGTFPAHTHDSLSILFFVLSCSHTHLSSWVFFFFFFFLLLTTYLIPYSFGLSYSYRKCYS